jgi:glycosyltransferase involved in cell wall biosynthesis
MHGLYSDITFEKTSSESIDIMPNTPRIIIVIPVYNHGRTLRNVVCQALEANKEVIVVDDGSTDGGAETISDLNVRLISHSENRGKGAAIMTASQEASILGATHIVTIDADGQHNPADLVRFIPIIEKNLDAIIIGARVFDPYTTPFGTRFGRAFSNIWLRVQTGYAIKDTQSGFRAYPLPLLKWLKLKDCYYSFEIEVLVKAAWAGVDLEEVDISVYYPSPSDRVSHFRPFLDNFRLSILNTKLTIRAVVPIPHKKFKPESEKTEKISLLRPLKLIRSLLGDNCSPQQLAAAGGLGVFIGAVPLIACQTITILFAASFLRLNKVMALAASQLCIVPFIPALCIEVGYFVRHGRFLTEVSIETIGYQGLERFFEWFLGSLILGPVLGFLVGITIYVTAIIIFKRIRPNDG